MTAYSDIAIDQSSNTPYVVYCDLTASVNIVTSFNGSSWGPVGTGTISAKAGYNSIAIHGGNPYVAYQDQSNSLMKGYAMMYNGSNWVTLGGGAFSTDTATDMSIAFSNIGEPMVAFADRASGKKAVLKKFTAGAWVNVGPAISSGTVAYVSLAVDLNTGTPYVAYQDIYNGGVPTVKMYNGTSWVAVGTGTLSSSSASYMSMAVNSSGTPYVAYLSSAGYTGVVKTFTAGAWQSVGSGTISNVYSSFNMTLDPIGQPYVTYYDLSMYKASAMTYNGSVWVYAGNSSFSNGTPVYNAIATDATGTPYVVCVDGNPPYVRKLISGTSITTQPSPTTICSGMSATFAVATNTTVPSYQWQLMLPGNIAYNNISNGSNYSGTSTANLAISSSSTSMSGYGYRCVMSDGCKNIITSTGLLTVNPLPTVTVSSATTCAGGTVTLNAAGGSTYLWSTGATTYSIVVSPTISTSYSATATNTYSCSSTATSVVTVLSSKLINGGVSSTAGPVSGNMILYKYKPNLSKWDSVAFTPFSSTYSFGLIDSGLYVIKAVPTATNVQITYAPSAVSWQNAAVIAHGCTYNLSKSIQIQPYATLPTGGTGVLSGYITEGQGYGHKPTSVTAPGNPIPGVVVKGGKNPGAAIFAQTTTNSAGNYSFTSVPDNNPGETYFILVDVPGLDTNGTYHRILTPVNNSYTTLNFVIDSMYVNPATSTSVNEINQADYMVKVFPNPAGGQVTVAYSLLKPSEVKIDLLDVVGKQITRIQPATMQPQGSYSPLLSTGDLAPGIYFVKLSIDGREATIKLFVTH